jgi:hypothetical protein
MSPLQPKSVRRNLSRDKRSFTVGLPSDYAPLVVSSNQKVSALRFGRTQHVIRDAIFAAFSAASVNQYPAEIQAIRDLSRSSLGSAMRNEEFPQALRKGDDFRHLNSRLSSIASCICRPSLSSNACRPDVHVALGIRQLPTFRA